jgi:hypothetical protein
MRSWSFKWLLALALSIVQWTGVHAQEKTYAIAAVGFYNLENLFDTEADSTINDEEFTPGGSKVWTVDKYELKLDNMARVISELAVDYIPDGIAVLGVSEIENRRVLEDLIQREALAGKDWGIVHYDSPDRRGVDVGLIYRQKYFDVIESRPVPLPVFDSEGNVRYTRDILFVKGLLYSDTIALMVNHWPSRFGGEKRTRKDRIKGAEICKGIADSIRQHSPDTRVIIMGDLNDDPTSPSVKKMLQAKGNKADVGRDGFFNPMHAFFKKGIGSNAYRDAWSVFDQVILSGNFVVEPKAGWQYYKAEIFRKPYLLQRTGRFKGYPYRTFAGDQFLKGYSDHLPVMVYLVKPLEE